MSGGRASWVDGAKRFLNNRADCSDRLHVVIDSTNRVLYDAFIQ